MQELFIEPTKYCTLTLRVSQSEFLEKLAIKYKTDKSTVARRILDLGINSYKRRESLAKNKPNPKIPDKDLAEIEEYFDVIWDDWSKKTAKSVSKRVFFKIATTPELAKKIRRAVRHYNTFNRLQDKPTKFIFQLSTFLNSHWEDWKDGPPQDVKDMEKSCMDI